MKAAVCREFGKPLVIEEVQLADAAFIELFYLLALGV